MRLRVACWRRLGSWIRWISGLDIWELRDAWRIVKELIDLAVDLARAGFYTRAVTLLLDTEAEPESGSEPLLLYLAAWFAEKEGNAEYAQSLREEAESCDMSYCFPSLLEEMRALEAALQKNPESCAGGVLSG